MNKKVSFEDLGTRDYKQVWDYQESLFTSVIDKKLANRASSENTPVPNHLLIVEHPHVYTLGRQGKEAHLLIDSEALERKNATFYKINRGGDITYHGPGQLVAYPIFDLDNFSPDIHLYVRNLEEVVIRTVAHWGIFGERSKGETGVWIAVGTPFARKICAIGVRTSRWVTMHGLALNVNTDLGYFDNIIPCGIRGKAVCSMESELGQKIDMEQVKEQMKTHFEVVFDCEME